MAIELLEEPRTQGRLFDFRHRITVEEYHRMIDAGVFGPEPRVELLEGVIVEKMTKKPPHVLATDLLDELLHHLLPRGSGYAISMGNPVTIEDRDGEPEPDAMVMRGRLRDYTGRRRTPADAALVIEVSQTSYHYDRYDKWVTYAAAVFPSTGSGSERAAVWKSIPSRRVKARPPLMPGRNSTARTTRSRSSSTAARSPGSP